MTKYPSSTDRFRLVERLRRRLSRLECRRLGTVGPSPVGSDDGDARGPDTHGERTVYSSGIGALDRLLTAGGFRPAELVDWLQEAPGGGAEALSLLAAAAICRDDGVLVVIDRRRTFYPPAAVALGVPLSRTIVVRVDNPRDEHWAFRQALACPAVRAVWGRIERLDAHAMRRLQLAAEQSGGVAMLVRPGGVRGQPTWAHTQLSVQPLLEQSQLGQPQLGQAQSARKELDQQESFQRGLGFRVELVRCRGTGGGSLTSSGACADLELNMADGVWCDVGKQQQTSGRHQIAELAGAATARRASRA